MALDIQTPHASPSPLNLRRRFALASLAVITAIAISLGWLLSHILHVRMTHREGEVSTEFIRQLLIIDASAGFLQNPQDPALRERFLRSMALLAEMREPVRIHAYGADGTILWSTEADRIGMRDAENHERDRALNGELAVESGRTAAPGRDKLEHDGLGPPGTLFVETYVPIQAPGSDRVIGVLEFYKTPPALDADIRQGVLQLWLACLLSAMGLFATLYWIVARADRLLRAQQARLDEAQTLASAVELASAVAHNLRNPLASIRSSAELMEHTPPGADHHAEYRQDIIHAVDRANRWITELVHVAQSSSLTPEPVALRELVQACLVEMSGEMTRRHVDWTLQPDNAGTVVAHPAMLRQIFISILANAMDAMPQGGTLLVTWVHDENQAGVCFADSGAGLSSEARQRLFRPFFSTKSGGLGLGLALVKRMMEQWRGSLTLTPAQPQGTRAVILLPRADPAARPDIAAPTAPTQAT